jgi:hypothetical protein
MPDTPEDMIRIWADRATRWLPNELLADAAFAVVVVATDHALSLVRRLR